MDSSSSFGSAPVLIGSLVYERVRADATLGPNISRGSDGRLSRACADWRGGTLSRTRPSASSTADGGPAESSSRTVSAKMPLATSPDAAPPSRPPGPEAPFGSRHERISLLDGATRHPSCRTISIRSWEPLPSSNRFRSSYVGQGPPQPAFPPAFPTDPSVRVSRIPASVIDTPRAGEGYKWIWGSRPNPGGGGTR